jgi:hypothetical protein
MIQYKHKSTGQLAEKFKNDTSHLYIIDDKYILPKEVVENSNDWELVIEKDYEILSFINRDNNLMYALNDGKYKTQYIDGRDGFSEIGSRHLQYCTTHYEINSIKRLSDNEIFTLGDTINFDTQGTCKLLRMIFEKAPVDKGTGILCFVNNCDNLGDVWHISQLKKLKTSLFTTNDGVEIFEGDDCWYVNTNNFDISFRKANVRQFIFCIFFSTEVAAKNYKAENEKRFSLHYIRQVLDKNFSKSFSYIAESQRHLKIVKDFENENL